MITLVVAGVLALALVDYLLRLPVWIRWIHLVVGLAGVAVLFRRRIIPAWRFRPSLTTVALYVESRRPASRGAIASAVELEGASAHEQGFAGELARLAASRAAAAVPPRAAAGLVARAPVVKAVAATVATVTAVVAIAAISPHTAGTAAQRTLMPWSGAEWPKRTDIEDATLVDLSPRGESVPIRAVLTRSVRLPKDTEVSVSVRLIEGDGVVDRYRMIAGWQGRTATARENGAEGELFELLVEGDGDAIEYRFESTDDVTPWRRITLVERPAVASANAEIRRPRYLSATAPADEPDALSVELGPGTDERAAAPASLVGSSVSVSMLLNKPIPAFPDDVLWRERIFGPDGPGLDVAVGAGGTRWDMSFELSAAARLRMNLVDEFGVESAEPVVFRFPAVEDAAPSAVVLNPAYDGTALPQAVLPVRATAQDDVGLAGAWVSAQRDAPSGGEPSGSGGAVEPVGEPVMLARATIRAGDITAEVRSEASMAELGARPGDVVRLWATAVDAYSFETGLREPVRSVERRLLIVSEDDFADQLRLSLSALRRDAIRLFEDQRSLSEATTAGETTAAQTRREQESITRDIERQRERIGSLREQIRTNRFDDPALDGLTREAGALAESAARASAAASEAAGVMENREDARREVERAQERSLDDLGELIALLDSGEDAWTARRNLERLIDQQREALAETARLGAETAGLSPSELTQAQRSEVESIAQRQRELAEQTRATTQDLREAQEQLQESDPSTASAVAEAAEQLERTDVASTMQQAAAQAEQNRTSRASALQQQALDDLEEALEELDNAERAREEQLRRLARSLVETIEGLVASQVIEIERLGAEAAGLDLAMIALHTRTLAAVDTALGARELRPVAGPLEGAAEAQLDAISSLRSAPPALDAAMTAERLSLEELERALAEAERLQEQIEQEATDRERQELEQAYRAALEAQIALRDQTRAAAAGEVDRRARAELRRLTVPQSELAASIADLFKKTQALEDAIVFRYAHGRLDEVFSGIDDALRTARQSDALADQGRAIALLRGMVEALAEDSGEDDDSFDEGGGGGGGSGGAGGEPELIPSGAQLKLLRAIQADVLDRTRAVDEGTRPLEDLDSLGAEQRELSELGQALIDELTQQPPVLAPPAPEGPSS